MNIKFKVYEKGVFGIKNPTAIIVLNSQNLQGNYNLFIDNKKVAYTVKSIQIENKMVLASSVGKGKKVVLEYEENGEHKNICEINNNLLIRLKNKIIGIVKNILMKMLNLIRVIIHGIHVLWRDYHFIVPFKEWKKMLIKLKNRILHNSICYHYNPFDQYDYLKWLNKYESIDCSEDFKYKPLISIVMPTYNVGKEYLSDCIDSVLEQCYQNFEICIADDCSTNQETLNVLKEYEEKDKRIKVIYREKNGHISKATNTALKIAKGEYVGLLDNDDVLAKNALYEIVKALNQDKGLDMIYSDEDKLDLNGKRCEPNFKPDFSPDTLLSLNYICHFVVIRKSLIDLIGGFEIGVEGAQDYDLLLKITEKTSNIMHIPKILYHWRKIPGSTSMAISNKNYALDKGKQVLENALKRRKIDAIVHKDAVSTYYYLEYIKKNTPLVSIIVPTKDHADITRICLESLYNKTSYQNFEVLLVNNNSEKQETFDLFGEFEKKYNNFKVIDANIPFNYSIINNMAVSQAQGEVLVLLNNDTEIIQEQWLDILVGYATQPHIGAVGPKLLYPDLTIQHGGVLIGLGGVASHAYIGEDRNFPGIYGRLRVPYNYAAVTAACLVIEKRKYNEIGGLEEELTVAYNDVDFNLKLLEKGYYNVFVPQVELIHHESKSRGLDSEGEKYKRFMKEEAYMYSKWDKYIKDDPFYNKNYTKKMWFLLDK
ncbi:glycosyltransferase family 2 protein [Thomasclavelia ramosa]|uniref:glycosyltransferase family 2 protein n=1 Tax=Thomasclavelia ramosa TaxID=1547 RepID=UPI0032C0BF4A